jgi:hypothetical protein
MTTDELATILAELTFEEAELVNRSLERSGVYTRVLAFRKVYADKPPRTYPDSPEEAFMTDSLRRFAEEQVDASMQRQRHDIRISADGDISFWRRVGDAAMRGLARVRR